jgi:hypothetical protein
VGNNYVFGGAYFLFEHFKNETSGIGGNRTDFKVLLEFKKVRLLRQPFSYSTKKVVSQTSKLANYVAFDTKCDI